MLSLYHWQALGQTNTEVTLDVVENPLLVPSDLAYGAPRFDLIQSKHFAPALEKAMQIHKSEIAAIVENGEAPSFDNTIAAMERSGQDLNRVMRIFNGLAVAHTNETIQATQREFAPRLAEHADSILLDPHLYARVRALFDKLDALDLNPEQMRLVERYHTAFVRSGAQLSAAEQARMRQINARLAALRAEFSRRLLAEVNDSAIIVESRDELVGLSDKQIKVAALEAAERGLEGKYVLTLVNTSGQPVAVNLQNRALRERIYRASVMRGSRGNDYDTRELLLETVRLRSEMAQMLGFEHYTDYLIAEQIAPSSEAVREMLAQTGAVAIANARREAAALQARIDATEPKPFELAPWDWGYFTEQLRAERFDINKAEVRPYFELQSVLEKGVFYAATQLFGIQFQRRSDLPVYHPDVQVWEILEEDGTPIGIMYGDFYARSEKRGGAWMNSYALQSRLLGDLPITGNHLNITKPPEGEATLLTWDEVTTLFHEFGHVLHGILSDVTYPYFSGTAVPRDFVEYPSQVYEMWAAWPAVMSNYARHYKTGEPISKDLVEHFIKSERFNQGFRATEYLAAAITDQHLHSLPIDALPKADELMDLEERLLAQSGMALASVPPRYRLPYFSHIMGGYGAAYYSYIWSEVLDADSTQWFRDHGGLTRENGRRFRELILSRGGSMEPMDMYREFAEKDPDPVHMLRKRGLLME